MALDWDFLERWDTISGILGSIVLAGSIIFWMVRKAGPERILNGLAWAVVGEPDGEKLILTVGNVAKWVAALVICAIIGVAAGLILAFILIFIFSALGLLDALGIVISDTLLKRFVALCAIIGAIIRMILPLINRIR